MSADPVAAADSDAEEAWDDIELVRPNDDALQEIATCLRAIASELRAARVRERVINVPSLYIRATADEKEEQ